MGALLTAGCGGPVPDYVSRSGASFYLQGAAWASEDIETQEQGFLAALSYTDGFNPRYVSICTGKVNVYVMPDRFACGTSSPSGYCNGTQIDGLIMVRDLGSPFNSAFTHEETHFLLWCARGETDGGHTRADLWKIADAQYGRVTP